MITKETMLIIKSNQKMLDIINTYMQDDMKKLKQICHKVWEGKVSTSEYEDLYDVATDCLIESVVQYDHSKSSFKTFLTGNIMRKTSTWIRAVSIHISEPTRLLSISYAVFCLKKKKKKKKNANILNYIKLYEIVRIIGESAIVITAPGTRAGYDKASIANAQRT